MNLANPQRAAARHLAGIAAVLLVHLALVWILVTGLAREAVEAVQLPMMAMLQDEPKPAPPPPLRPAPPPPRAMPPRPAPATPPAVISAPEIQRAAPHSPAITSVPVAPAPALPAPSTAPEAPPAPLVRTAPVINFSDCTKPDYTAAARRAEAQGSTLISFLIDTDGHVLESRIDRSAGPSREHKMLDRLAVEALSQCRFRPGTVGGQAERSWSRVEYVWKLLD